MHDGFPAKFGEGGIMGTTPALQRDRPDTPHQQQKQEDNGGQWDVQDSRDLGTVVRDGECNWDLG